MDYAQLSAAIRAYAENEFPQTVGTVTSVQQINYFIEQAEERIYNNVQFPSLRKNTTGSVTANSPYVSAPDDFLAVYSLAVIDNVTGAYDYLLNKDVNFIREVYPNPNSTGKPRFYALFGPETTNANPPVITKEWSLILGPTPNLAYTLELHYYYYPESITTAGTTWLGDNMSPALLYGALLEAATFMKSDADTLTTYQKRYDEALAMAKRLGDGMGRQDAYRSGQVRYPVT